MIPPDPLASVRREDLGALVAALQRQNAALQRPVGELTADHEALWAELEQRKRSGKRQAAPCSKGTRERAPKRPGPGGGRDGQGLRAVAGRGVAGAGRAYR